MVGLVLLFVLTIAATWSWQRLSRRPGAVEEIAHPAEVAAAPSSGLPAGDDTLLVPSVAYRSREGAVSPPPNLQLVDPAMLAEAPSSGEFLAAEPSSFVAAESDEPDGDLWAAPALEGYDDYTVVEDRAIAVETARTQRPRPTVEDLTRVRDALLGVLQRVREIPLPAPAAKPSEPRQAIRGPQLTSPRTVRVTAPTDRLAMLPPRPSAAARESRRADLPMKTLELDAATIATLRDEWSLLSADDSRIVPRYLGPRLALRDSFADPGFEVDDLRKQPAADVALLLRTVPASLLEQVAAVEAFASSASWSVAVRTALERLSLPGHTARWEASTDLAELDQLAARGFQSALTTPNPVHQRNWLRASRSLQRRLTLWHALADEALCAATMAAQEAPVEEVRHRLQEVATLVAGEGHGAAWREYLQLEEIAALASVGGAEKAQSRREVARTTLLRMTSPDLTSQQQEFLQHEMLRGLQLPLRQWATGPVDLEDLAARIERYEATVTPHDGVAIAEAVLRLRWNDDPRLQALADTIDRQYRNANVRLAITADLVNRLVPPEQRTMAPVRDRVAGTEVRGRSQVSTQLRLRFIPDATQWKLGLDAFGHIHSTTYSRAWPARLRNVGNLQFDAQKIILVSPEGLSTLPAYASAQGRNSLVGVDTHFDPIPLVGDLFQGVARSRHRQREPQAMAQTKSKVARAARTKLDTQSEQKLKEIEAAFRDTVLAPLQRLAVVAEPVDMHTTERRAVMRLRMADEQQLGAHTPRPSAPSDSLASFQLHESALNNAAQGLDLQGRQFGVEELYLVLADKLQLAVEGPPEDLPRRARVTFAQVDPVRVRCEGDRVKVCLRFARIALGRDSIRDVEVFADYRPRIEGMRVGLDRDGALSFKGPHLRTGPRMVLHGIFNKFLPCDETIWALDTRLQQDPRLEGVMLTQLVIEDGWVAVAMGPASQERTAWRSTPSVTR
jgi:hypothetical protein